MKHFLFAAMILTICTGAGAAPLRETPQVAVAPAGLQPTPTLDELAASVLELRARIIKLDISNGQLRRQVKALASHTHSLGGRSTASGTNSVTLAQLKRLLDDPDSLNRCSNCVMEYKIGPFHNADWISGPPILPSE
jgi:hypothetical protein